MLQNSENSQTSCTICYATEEIWLWTGGKCTLVQSGMGLMNMNETGKNTIELIEMFNVFRKRSNLDLNITAKGFLILLLLL